MEPQQVRERDGVSRGLRAVVARLVTREKLLLIVGGEEEASAGFVLVVKLEDVIEPDGLLEPAEAARRLVEIEERSDEKGMVVEVSGVLRLTVLVAAEQAAVSPS